MRAAVPAPEDVGGWSVRADSWLGSRALAVGVPLLGGSVTWATGAPVLEESAVDVPLVTEDQDWWPRADPDHPLARFGQRLQYTLIMEAATGPVEVVLARHQVHDWARRSGGEIAVTCESTIAVLAADELDAPLVTDGRGPLTDAAAQLAGAEGVVVSPALANRRIPARAWGESRVEALREIAASWPARLRLDPWGRVLFLPSLPEVPRPALSFTDGEGGTVVSVDGIEDSREGVANVVVAEGEDQAGVAFRITREVEHGPLAPARYGRVTRRIKSDLVTSREAGFAVAGAGLAESVVRAQTWRITCPPDWRIEVDDPVEVTYRGVTVWGWVTGMVAPVVPGDSMRIDVGVIA